MKIFHWRTMRLRCFKDPCDNLLDAGFEQNKQPTFRRSLGSCSAGIYGITATRYKVPEWCATNSGFLRSERLRAPAGHRPSLQGTGPSGSLWNRLLSFCGIHLPSVKSRQHLTQPSVKDLYLLMLCPSTEGVCTKARSGEEHRDTSVSKHA